MTPRESITKKLNTESKFGFLGDEIQYIIKDWVSMHSQHQTKVEIHFDPTNGIWADVELNKESIFRYF